MTQKELDDTIKTIVENQIKDMRELAYNLSDDPDWKQIIAISSDEQVRQTLLDNGFTTDDEVSYDTTI